MGALSIVAVLFGSSAQAQTADTGEDTGTAPEETADTGTTATGDTGVEDPGADLDLDGDGFTPREGDCNDDEPESHAGLAEVCGDRVDNNCDGLFDEGCDDAIRLATVRGGGGCTSGTGIAGTQGALLILPFTLLGWLVGSRRR